MSYLGEDNLPTRLGSSSGWYGEVGRGANGDDDDVGSVVVVCVHRLVHVRRSAGAVGRLHLQGDVVVSGVGLTAATWARRRRAKIVHRLRIMLTVVGEERSNARLDLLHQVQYLSQQLENCQEMLVLQSGHGECLRQAETGELIPEICLFNGRAGKNCSRPYTYAGELISPALTSKRALRSPACLLSPTLSRSCRLN